MGNSDLNDSVNTSCESFDSASLRFSVRQFENLNDVILCSIT